MPVWFIVWTMLFQIAIAIWCYVMWKLVREIKVERILRTIEKVRDWV